MASKVSAIGSYVKQRAAPFAKPLVEFLALLTNMDLMLNSQDDFNDDDRRTKQLSILAMRISAHQVKIAANSGGGREGRKRAANSQGFCDRRKRYKWPKLVGLVYLMCNAHILASLCLQYAYDVRLLQVARLVNDSTPQTLGLFEQFEHEMIRLRRALDLVGAPFVESHFVTECFIQALLFLCAVFFALPRFVASRVPVLVPRNFPMARTIIAHDTERRLFKAYLFKFAQNLLDSKCFYLANQCTPCQQLKQAICTLHDSRLKFCDAELLSNTRVALERMIADDALLPENLKLSWVNKTRSYFVLSLCFFYFLGLAASTTHVPLLLDRPVRFNSLMDALIIIEMLFMVFLLAAAIATVLTLVSLTAFEQVRLCHIIAMNLIQTTRLNARRFHAVCALTICLQLKPTTGADRCAVAVAVARLRDAMNLDLLYNLSKYKIHVNRLKPLLRTNGFIFFCANITLIMYPANCLLHQAYVNEYEQPSFKRNVILFCILMVLGSLLGYILSCKLVVYGEKLERCLFNLIAHTAEVKTYMGRLYDPHTLEMLRREVRNPEMVTRRFSFEFAGIRNSWPNTLRIYFWVGILLVYLFINSNMDSNSVLRGFVKDPLGLLQ